MKVGIIFAFMDFHRKGLHNRGVLQPQIGPLIAALLPDTLEIDIINDTWEEPDWNRHYDLLFIASMHSDFDRARQISHYWRRRGAKTVYGGIMASTYPQLCQPFFDAVVIGDPEGTVQRIYQDFCQGELKSLYLSEPYEATAVRTPRFDLLADKQILPLTLEATRGCPFTCDFCALTGLGTRFHHRPVASVVEDIKAGQQMLTGLIPRHKERMVLFCDNNIGGNPRYLRELCEALTLLDIRWASAITFNVVENPDTVKMLSHSGCRALFMGLESFNPAAISDMHKFQNNINKTKSVITQCRKNGILVTSGLMVSPTIDDCRYIETIPERLKECGLHVPSFLCFECPFPGTPYFHRLAAQDEPAFLPNALLRDFTGYTLVVKPRLESTDQFIKSYKAVLETVFSKRTRFVKLTDDLRHFMGNGFFIPGLVDTLHLKQLAFRPHPERTYVASTDTPPPEASSVPFENDDFDSEEQRRTILEPMQVTDSAGHVLPIWYQSTTTFKPKGRLTNAARALATS